MSPIPSWLPLIEKRFAGPSTRWSPTDFHAARDQWINPQDVLTILTIIGGNVVQAALAQLAGNGQHPYSFVPIAFSFGWVSYAFTAICAVFGEFAMLPTPDCNCTVINAKSKQSRDNRSWVLGRIVRDVGPTDKTAALQIMVYDMEGRKSTEDGKTLGSREQGDMGVAKKDGLYWFGVAVIAVQMGVACIPGALFGHWLILVLTVAGTILAQAQSWLPQWRTEKWSARAVRTDKTEITCLTRGNGSRVALVILSKGVGLRLEDMAGGYTAFRLEKASALGTIMLAILWIAHLITIQSLDSGSETWFLLAVGALGMRQNIVAASAKRTPGALGVHLDQKYTITGVKVLEALKELELKVPKAGLALVDVYFPAGLRANEKECFEDTRVSSLDDMRRVLGIDTKGTPGPSTPKTNAPQVSALPELVDNSASGSSRLPGGGLAERISDWLK